MRTLLMAVRWCCSPRSALLMGAAVPAGHDPSRVYYGTDTRAQSLLVGAVLAMLLLRVGAIRGRIAGPALQTAGLACAAGLGFLWSTTSEDSALLYRGGLLFIAVTVAVVIAAAVQPKAGLLGRALSLPPLRALGLISYGVYLWHWPVYLVLTPGRTGWDGYGLFAVRVLATLAIATLSYRLLEMPVRRGAFRGWKMSWGLAPAGAMALAVALVLVTRGAVFPVSTPAETMPAACRDDGAERPFASCSWAIPSRCRWSRDWTRWGGSRTLSIWNRADPRLWLRSRRQGYRLPVEALERAGGQV